MRVLIIDNFDSFTFNLYQYTGEILMSSRSRQSADPDVIVKRNNEISIEEIKKLKPDRIIISPGPGSPDDEKYFGVCSQAILELGQEIPLMGVCLGMQGIAHCFGGRVIRAPIPMHGKISSIQHDSKGLFKGMPQYLEIMRYHSLMVEADSLPECLEVTSVVNDSLSPVNDLAEAARSGQVIMGVRHRHYPIEGIQFHPESFATEGAKTILTNFLL
ncbi:MAG TPA: aminodeoxychorismate/anthranilate synthase component II [Cellvibrio sp.]|nr:aminodeoxychorismate/anthranilate synthase component II [Cellvibrio sp.]